MSLFICQITSEGWRQREFTVLTVWFRTWPCNSYVKSEVQASKMFHRVRLTVPNSKYVERLPIYVLINDFMSLSTQFGLYKIISWLFLLQKYSLDPSLIQPFLKISLSSWKWNSQIKASRWLFLEIYLIGSQWFWFYGSCS